MCLWSNEAASRRAREGETAVIAMIGHRKVAKPALPEADILCVCLRTDDRVQFNSLPRKFRNRHAVPKTAVAVFMEGSADRDQDDRFDFQNGEVVPMTQIPTGATFNVRELVGQPRQQKPPAVEARQPEPELVGVGTAVHSGVFGANTRRVGAALVLAIATLLMD